MASCASSPVPEDPILSRLSPPPLRARTEGTPFRIAVEKISILYEGGEPEEVVRLVDRLFPGHGSGPADALLILALGDRIRNWADEFGLTPDECRFAGDEAYVLATRYRPKEKLILCAGPTPRALAYALVTLERSTRRDVTNRLIIPAFTVIDAPAVAVRGIVENPGFGWTLKDRRGMLEFALDWKINQVKLAPPADESAELAEWARRNFVDLEVRQGSHQPIQASATLDLQPLPARPIPTPGALHMTISGFPETSKIRAASFADSLWNPSAYDPAISWAKAAAEITALPPHEFPAFQRIVDRVVGLGPDSSYQRMEKIFLEHGRTADLRSFLSTLIDDVELTKGSLARTAPALEREIAPWLDRIVVESRAGRAALEFWDVVRYDADPMVALNLYRDYETRLPADSFPANSLDLSALRQFTENRASEYFGLQRSPVADGTGNPSGEGRIHLLPETKPLTVAAGTHGAIVQLIEEKTLILNLLCVVQDNSSPLPPSARLQTTSDGSRWEDVARLDRPVVRLTFRRRPAKGFRIWVDKPLEKEARLMKVGYRWASDPKQESPNDK